MATSNPKISAYVPQHIFKRFKQYEKDQGLSMSQAVADVLAKYFDLPSSQERTVVSSVIPDEFLDRISSLEKKVEALEKIAIPASTAPGNNLVFTSSFANPHSDNPYSFETDSFDGFDAAEERLKSSEPQDEPFSEPLDEFETDAVDEFYENTPEPRPSEPQGEPPGEPPFVCESAAEAEAQFLDEPPDEPPGESVARKLSRSQLALRLGMHEDTLTKRFTEMSKQSSERFEKWSAQKDPKGIAWRRLSGRTAGFISIGRLCEPHDEPQGGLPLNSSPDPEISE